MVDKQIKLEDFLKQIEKEIQSSTYFNLTLTKHNGDDKKVSVTTIEGDRESATGKNCTRRLEDTHYYGFITAKTFNAAQEPMNVVSSVESDLNECVKYGAPKINVTKHGMCYTKYNIDTSRDDQIYEKDFPNCKYIFRLDRSYMFVKTKQCKDHTIMHNTDYIRNHGTEDLCLYVEYGDDYGNANLSLPPGQHYRSDKIYKISIRGTERKSLIYAIGCTFEGDFSDQPHESLLKGATRYLQNDLDGPFMWEFKR